MTPQQRERNVPATSGEARSASTQVVVGAVDRSFGVHGEMLVTSLSDVPGRFRVGASMRLVGVRGRTVDTVITTLRNHGERLIVGLEAIRTPEDVAEFRGGYLYAERGNAAPPAGRFFQCDLLGLVVVDEQGRALGVVDYILESPGHHTFVVRQEKHEHLIPAVKEWVLAVDLGQRTMTVRVPETVEVPQARPVKVSDAM